MTTAALLNFRMEYALAMCAQKNIDPEAKGEYGINKYEQFIRGNLMISSLYELLPEIQADIGEKKAKKLVALVLKETWPSP